MTDPTTPQHEALAADLKRLFDSSGRASEAAKTTAKDLFGLRHIGDELAEMTEHDQQGKPLEAQLVGARGTTDGLEFRFADLLVATSVEPGRLHLLVQAEQACEAIIESGSGSVLVPLDETGGASVATMGTVRVRVKRDGQPDAVTDPIVVPPS